MQLLNRQVREAGSKRYIMMGRRIYKMLNNAKILQEILEFAVKKCGGDISKALGLFGVLAKDGAAIIMDMMKNKK